MNLLKSAAVTACCAIGACAATPDRPVQHQVRGDAMMESLTSVPGEPSRGRDVVAGRDGNCLLCHHVPETGERFMGDLAPSLTGVGARLSAGQIRLRIVDPTRVNPDAIMPSYHRVHDLDCVAAQYRGEPILTAQQVEDVVAYLVTLR